MACIRTIELSNLCCMYTFFIVDVLRVRENSEALSFLDTLIPYLETLPPFKYLRHRWIFANSFQHVHRKQQTLNSWLRPKAGNADEVDEENEHFVSSIETGMRAMWVMQGHEYGTFR